MNRDVTDEGMALRGACDCHVHVIGPIEAYALTPVRSYTPQPATADDLIDMMKRSRIDRAVIVQPSVFGVDNQCALDALPRLMEAGLQGRVVAVLGADHTPSHIDHLHACGVRGLRVNLQSHAGASLDQATQQIQAASVICERNGWHLQLFVDRQTIHALKTVLQALPVPIVLDHFAGLSVDGVEDVEDEASRSVLGLLASGQVWIKLSGTYRLTRDPFDTRLATLAQRLAAINPERLVWASDWPHTPKHQGQPMVNPPVQPYRAINTARLRQMVDTWFAPAVGDQVLVHNPARLYQFTTLTD